MDRTLNVTGQITRTQGTAALYRYRVRGMIKKAVNEGFVADLHNVNSIDLAKWLIEHKSNYCAATYRQYRSALIFWINESNSPNGKYAIDLLNAENHVANLKRGLSNRTSAKKSKQLSDKDCHEIICWLKNNPTRYSLALTIFLRIGASVGLRPCEWKTARVTRLEDGSAVLQVINAKATNGRGNGKVRTLLLRDLPLWMVDLIDKFISIIRKLDDKGKWDNFYNGCRKTLYLASRKLWPNRKRYPTLYSMRHQFCADAKSAGLSRIEVAALMGHASDDTAKLHYGKKRVGRGSCAVSPSDKDIERLAEKCDFVAIELIYT